MQVSNIVITDAIVALALEDNRDTRVAKALALLKYYRENKMKGDQS